jgi:hypothetical protein
MLPVCEFARILFQKGLPTLAKEKGANAGDGGHQKEEQQAGVEFCREK